MPLQPQAALEQAVVDTLVAAAGLDATKCGRTFDGQPPPRCGLSYVAVWSGGGQQIGRGDRQGLDQLFKINVTVTLRTVQPFDRKVKHRDEMEAVMNPIVALVHNDAWAMSIRKAANDLMGLRDPATGSGPPGFVQALGWEGTDDIRTVGAEWFWASSGGKESGIAQTSRFGKARLIQYQLGLSRT